MRSSHKNSASASLARTDGSASLEQFITELENKNLLTPLEAQIYELAEVSPIVR
jgi:hypothetical protein